MAAETQIDNELTVSKKRVYKRRDRRGVQLPIPRSLYRKFRRRARAEGLPFTNWLVRLAVKELRRRKSGL